MYIYIYVYIYICTLFNFLVSLVPFKVLLP